MGLLVPEVLPDPRETAAMYTEFPCSSEASRTLHDTVPLTRSGCVASFHFWSCDQNFLIKAGKMTQWLKAFIPQVRWLELEP